MFETRFYTASRVSQCTMVGNSTFSSQVSKSEVLQRIAFSLYMFSTYVDILLAPYRLKPYGKQVKYTVPVHPQ